MNKLVYESCFFHTAVVRRWQCGGVLLLKESEVELQNLLHHIAIDFLEGFDSETKLKMNRPTQGSFFQTMLSIAQCAE